MLVGDLRGDLVRELEHVLGPGSEAAVEPAVACRLHLLHGALECGLADRRDGQLGFLHRFGQGVGEVDVDLRHGVIVGLERGYVKAVAKTSRGATLSAVAAPTPAIAALVRARVEHRVHAYDHDPSVESFGEEAVRGNGRRRRAGCSRRLIVSTGATLVVGVVPVAGDARHEGAGRRRSERSVVEMADPAAAERSTGYLVGAISPIGQKRRLDDRRRRVRARVGHDLLQRGTAGPRGRAGAASAARGHGAGRPPSRRRRGSASGVTRAEGWSASCQAR